MQRAQVLHAAGRRTIGAISLAGCALLAGCASDGNLLGSGTTTVASDTARLTRSGFLSDYARLRPTTWGQGIECWRDPALDASRYGAILVSRIDVSLRPRDGGQQTFDPKDLATLTDYFHHALVKALQPQMQIAKQPGAGVVVLRVALTDLVPTKVTDSLAGTLIPYGFVAEAGSGAATGRPAGSTPYMGETGMEMQFRDGASGRILGECRDTEIGRKYAVDANASAVGAAQTWANGYLSSFEAWTYARDAFDKWSLLVAQRIAQLRAGQP